MNKRSKAQQEASETKNRYLEVSKLSLQAAMDRFGTQSNGLSEEQVDDNIGEYGKNVLSKKKETPWWKHLLKAFIDPFTLILVLLAGVSLVSNVILPPAGEKNPSTVIIIVVMVIASGLIRFFQETRSSRAAARLYDLVENSTTVFREGKKKEIPISELAVGDLVYLGVGDIIPADLRLLETKDFFIDESSLTGESLSVEKSAAPVTYDASLTALPNMAYMGSAVVSGSARGLVVGVGDSTFLGGISASLQEKEKPTGFERGIGKVSWVLIRFMLVMTPVVFLLNGFIKNDWLSAFLFAISVAVGLTPEMLPMIVTSCLAKGALSLSKKKCIVKSLSSIQNLGSMDVLCTDKTGTLTENRVILERHMNVRGEEDNRVLRHAYLNSYFTTGSKNLMDQAIIERNELEEKNDHTLEDLSEKYTKVDEIPFDFERRRVSVVVMNKEGKTQLITKGALEEILSICTFAEVGSEVLPLDEALKNEVIERVSRLNDSGMRVLALAQKNNPESVARFGVADENGMVLLGYLAFLDPVKPSAQGAISSLQHYGVTVKVLTGDTVGVARTVCEKVGIDSSKPLTGEDVEKMSDEELRTQVETTNLFAKLSPEEKKRVIEAIQANGHIVGYMGDGVNDAPSLKASDVGLSVEGAVDIAKEEAKIILLEKDLSVLYEGIKEGRRIYGNLIKYIKMTCSSNFGNMFSVLFASAFLPFLPMMPVQLVFLNLLYDFSCISIPWDHVDESFLMKPRRWDAGSLWKFMLWFGPTSSVFDIVTYLLLLYVIVPGVVGGQFETAGVDQTAFIALFQSGWFIESMFTQVLVIHMIRSEKTPFVGSHASWPVLVSGLLCIAVASSIPYTDFGRLLGFSPLPAIFFAYLAGIIALYMLLTTLVKKIFIHRNHYLL